jgi:hypothetical protein
VAEPYALDYHCADPRHGRDYDADGEDRETDREGGPQYGLAPVPRSLRLLRLGPVGSRGGVPAAQPMPGPDQGRIPAQGQVAHHAEGGGHAQGQPEPPRPGVRRARPDLVADLLQAVRARLHMIRGSMQGVAHEVGELIALRPVGAVTGSHHYSRSNAERRAVMPRAV